MGAENRVITLEHTHTLQAENVRLLQVAWALRTENRVMALAHTHTHFKQRTCVYYTLRGR